MTGAERIAAERQRQIWVEGYDAGHDAGQADELAVAGAVYAIPPAERKLEGDVGIGVSVAVDLVDALWPWEPRFWKPTAKGSNEGRIRELEKAGALIAAAIDDLLDDQAEPSA